MNTRPQQKALAVIAYGKGFLTPEPAGTGSLGDRVGLWKRRPDNGGSRSSVPKICHFFRVRNSRNPPRLARHSMPPEKGNRSMKCLFCEDCGWVCENHPDQPGKARTPAPAAALARPARLAIGRGQMSRRDCQRASRPTRERNPDGRAPSEPSSENPLRPGGGHAVMGNHRIGHGRRPRRASGLNLARITDLCSLFDHDEPGCHQPAVSQGEPIRRQPRADARRVSGLPCAGHP
jgi:hypothetical protein